MSQDYFSAPESSQTRQLRWSGPHLHDYAGREGAWEEENSMMNTDMARVAADVPLTLSLIDRGLAVYSEFLSYVDPMTFSAHRKTLDQTDTSWHDNHID